jgi:sugar (pentulose or hexulose) kinase
MEACLLGIDVGTTNCKAGVFTNFGRLLAAASRPTLAHQSSSGYTYFEAGEIWSAILDTCEEVCSKVDANTIAGVGVASMAETGLLIDRLSGQPGSWMVPWFDKGASSKALSLERQFGEAGFYKTGIYPNFKCGLAKILWLRDEFNIPLSGMAWLSAADYIVFRMTGRMATDYSLAGRTYAFDLDKKEWDQERLKSLRVDPSIFPDAVPSGEIVGRASGNICTRLGMKEGTPVVIAGHDHVCGSFAVGALQPDHIFNSMGTAEAMLGTFEDRRLGAAELRSGLTFGLHAARGKRYWMGGLSASGGSLDWVRRVLGYPALNFDDLEELASRIEPEPTGIIYFPYLTGSGSPHTDLNVRAAFIGLDSGHGRAHIVRAVFEGTAFEMEFIRRTAVEGVGIKGEALLASGGGTRSRTWMQIKADVSGCRVESLKMQETTLLGAALLAGVGAGVFRDEDEVCAPSGHLEKEIYLPDEKRHAAYRQIYETDFIGMQSAMRNFGKIKLS